MELSARLDKIIRDLWENKQRSLLVIITLAIGLSAVGMIHNTVRMLKRDLYGQFAERNPAGVVLYVSPFPEELARDVQGLREVERAEARRVTSAFVTDRSGQRHSMQLVAAPDYSEIQINQLGYDQPFAPPDSPAPPVSPAPPLRGVLVERSTATGLGLKAGDLLEIEMEGGSGDSAKRHYQLAVSGIVHDMSREPYSISGEALGYVSLPTLAWMGQGAYYNQIRLVTAENKTDRQHVLAVASLARDRIIEPAGYVVGAISIPSSDGQPGNYWARKQADGVLLVLQIMSILAIFLSAGLVVNTISAILVQQIKQIGIMRSIGATRRQIISLYLLYVLILSLTGVILALPLGLLGAWGLSIVAAGFMNYQIGPVDLPANILLMQVGLGLLMPLAVALWPIMQGTQISVYDAIYQYGLISGEGKRGWIERRLVQIRQLSPPVMLSLRNTFRNKSRLAFTLVTLTIAGAMFMAVFSSYTTINRQVEELGRYIAFDASLDIPGGADRHTVEREARRIPGVSVAEGWASTNAVIVQPNGAESDRIEVIGLPYDARTITPRLVAGRWLQAGDIDKAVINEDLLFIEPDIQVGDTLTVKINGQERSIQVVGIVSKHMVGSRLYMDYDELSKITGRPNQVDIVRVLGTPAAPSGLSEISASHLLAAAIQPVGVNTSASEVQAQEGLKTRLEKRFEDAKLSDGTGRTRAEIFDAIGNAFNILLVILLLVAGILAVIGGLGLTGAMGLNVLERTREIGVLRAVGASHRSVRQVVVVEGVAVAIISWLLAALASYPAGILLSKSVVNTAFGTDAPFSYSYAGLAVWLAIVILIGVVASLAPARDASRLTVREVLNYQ